MDAVVFYLSALVSLAASILVVTRRNPVYGAIFLVLFFTTISLDFLILRAPFLAVIQVLVYAGAIMVLYLFVIMLLSLKPEELREEVGVPRKAAAALFSGGLFCLLAYAIRGSTLVRDTPDLAGPLPPPLAEAGTTAAIGEELFRHHLLPFEVTSVLILIAIIGAIYLTKRRERHGGGPEARPGGFPASTGHSGSGVSLAGTPSVNLAGASAGQPALLTAAAGGSRGEEVR